MQNPTHNAPHSDRIFEETLRNKLSSLTLDLTCSFIYAFYFFQFRTDVSLLSVSPVMANEGEGTFYWSKQQSVICTATKIPFVYSCSRNCAASVPISTFMSLWAIYIPRIVPHIFLQTSVGIYKSLIDTWMWKLGLWPCNSFSGNICFEFSVLCLCSVCCDVRGEWDWKKGATKEQAHVDGLRLTTPARKD